VKFLTRTQKYDGQFFLKNMFNESEYVEDYLLMGFGHFDFVSPGNYFGGTAAL